MNDLYEQYKRHCEKNRQPCLPEQEFIRLYEKRKYEETRESMQKFIKIACPTGTEHVPDYERYIAWCKKQNCWSEDRLGYDLRRKAAEAEHANNAMEAFIKERWTTPLQSLPGYAAFVEWGRRKGCMMPADSVGFLTRWRKAMNVNAANALKTFLDRKGGAPVVFAGRNADVVPGMATVWYPEYTALCAQSRYVVYPAAFFPAILEWFRFPFRMVTVTCQTCGGRRTVPTQRCPSCGGRGKVAGNRRIVGGEVIPDVGGVDVHRTYYETDYVWCGQCNGQGWKFGPCGQCDPFTGKVTVQEPKDAPEFGFELCETGSGQA